MSSFQTSFSNYFTKFVRVFSLFSTLRFILQTVESVENNTCNVKNKYISTITHND